MVGTVSDDSFELENLEPEKCESWNWTPWARIVDMKYEEEVVLFDPMIHLIDELNTKEPSFLYL